MAHFVLILSHMLQRDGSLNEESIKRAHRGAEIFTVENANFIITSGGSERVHGDRAIADVTRNFLITQCGIDGNRIIADTRSRDTVGDAYFISDHLNASSRVTIVTSEYHVNRVKHIFKFFLSDKIVIKVAGVDHPVEPELIAHENESLSKFIAQFPTKNLSRKELFEVLRSEHPFYNGEIFTRLTLTGDETR